MSDIRGPTDTKRTVILGRTGSGKTQGGINLLSQMNFDQMPWVIVDYKGDELIEKIVKQNKLQTIDLTKNPPTKPGLYYVQPIPKVQDQLIEEWLWRVWKQENVGLFVDEGYALPQREAFDVILTQGRAKHIPVIILYQRPVYMSRFAVAQADFFAVFEQNDRRDLKTTNQFIGEKVLSNGTILNAYSKLPEYYCLWYDVGRGKTDVLSPCPSEQEILKTFRSRLGTKERKATGAMI